MSTIVHMESKQGSSGSGLRFNPQLSGLRFYAVAFVIIYHFSYSIIRFKKVFDLGAFIVYFFVLSSYLITRILLISKRKSVAAGISEWKVALAFFLRRIIRIFPAYYLYLLLLFLLPLEGQELRQHLSMYLLQLTNILLFITKSWGTYTAHLWTLGVEEQFYLIWPWSILFIPDRHLPKFFACMFLVGILFRVIMTFRMTDPPVEMFPMLVLLPACLDSFAAGAFLAYLHDRGYIHNNWIRWLLFISLPLWVYLILSHNLVTFAALNRVFVSLFCLALIDQANRGFKGLSGKFFLENPLIQYLAKISYGIYLYHIIAADLFWKFFDFLDRHFKNSHIDLSGLRTFISGSPPVRMFVFIGVAVLLASCSWYLVEQPINKLRKKVSQLIPAKKAGHG